MTLRFLNGVLAGAFIGFAGCGPRDLDHLELRTSEISGGQMEPGYPAIGCLTDSGSGICTGSLIAPNLVL